MNASRKMRLGPLPKLESTKLTFTCSASLKANLDLYAAQHAQTYGEAVDAATLIPHMLESFIARDRAFKKQHAAGPDASTRRLATKGSTGAIGVDVLPEGGTKK